ncbi:MAG: thioesterase family protein [Deltaproteobacteria bacterium]|nr:thioesterase family protein [Deltaproteobacteria bacterium]
MPRIKIEEKDYYDYIYKLKTQVHHLNYSGHVGHDAVIQIIWEARTNFLNELGFTELDLGDKKTGLVITDLIVLFKKELFLFDELLIETRVDDISNSGFRMYHRITKNGITCVLAEIGFLSFDYNTRRVSRLPEAFKQALKLRAKKSVKNIEPAGE